MSGSSIKPSAATLSFQEHLGRWQSHSVRTLIARYKHQRHCITGVPVKRSTQGSQAPEASSFTAPADQLQPRGLCACASLRERTFDHRSLQLRQPTLWPGRPEPGQLAVSKHSQPAHPTHQGKVSSRVAARDHTPLRLSGQLLT